MSVPDNQSAYWNSAGTTKTFGHPLEPGWLGGLDPAARVVDYGCGYGRVTGLLRDDGFTRVEGVDFAPAMIASARERRPDIRFTDLADPPALPYADGGVDAVMLFAVLTCIPSDTGQRELVGELRRVLRGGGLLYLSDLCLQADERNLSRYERFAEDYGRYGIFATNDGAVCRHHTRVWLDELLTGFTVTRDRDIAVETMNGYPGRATQLLAVKP